MVVVCLKGLDLLKFVEINVCVGVFLCPCGVQPLDVLAGYDVGVCDFLNVAERIINVLEVLVKVFLLWSADVNIIVIREPPFIGVVSFKINLTPRFFSYKIRRQSLIL